MNTYLVYYANNLELIGLYNADDVMPNAVTVLNKNLIHAKFTGSDIYAAVPHEQLDGSWLAY
jgi:hypothetical protein